MAGRGRPTVDRGPRRLASDFDVDAAVTPDTINGLVNMPRKVARSTATPVKKEGNATTSAAPVEAVTRLPCGVASLTAHLAQHGFAPPHPFALLFPRMTPAAQAALTESIRLNGMRDPITVFNDQTADGLSRCISAIELGLRWEELRKDEFEGDEAALLQFVIDKNLRRGHLDESQRAMVAARLATMKQGARTDLPRICGMSQQEAADRMNVGVRLVQHAVKVINEGVPELLAAVDSGILTVTAAVTALNLNLTPDQQRAMVDLSLTERKPAKTFAKAVRAEENDSCHRQIVANARRHDLTGKRYLIGLADIPWRGDIAQGKRSRYPRLSIEEVCAFRLDDGRLIRDAMADTSILFLWIRDGVIFKIPRILKAWGGFKLKHFMVWPKINIGLGQYARPQQELVLLCVRGNFPTPLEALRPSTLIVGSRLAGGNGFEFALPHDRRQSSKPPRLQEMIEHPYPQCFGNGTIESPLALELFARTYRPRWDGQGYEYPGRPDGGAVEELPPETRHDRADARPGPHLNA
jgi:N6-adenosine-specific RNA methylase IME4